MAYSEWGPAPFNLTLNINNFELESGTTNVAVKPVLIDPEANSASPVSIVTGAGRINDNINFGGWITGPTYTSIINDYNTSTANTLKFGSVNYYCLLTKFTASYKIEEGIPNKVWFTASAIIL